MPSSKRSFPPLYCTCGAPLKNTYDLDTKWPWCSYECGTMRAATGTDPFPDTNRMRETSAMCRYATELRKTAGLTPAKARKIYESIR